MFEDSLLEDQYCKEINEPLDEDYVSWNCRIGERESCEECKNKDINICQECMEA